MSVSGSMWQRLSGLRMEAVTGENTMSSFIICSPCQILLESNRTRCMEYVALMEQKHTHFDRKI